MERENAQGVGAGSEPLYKQDRRRLPPELADLLPRKLEQGLDHVTRRRILRALHVSEKGRSSVQLSQEKGPLNDVSLSSVAYHMNVLARYEMVSEVGTRQNRGALEHFYISEVEADPLVLSILVQTEELDAPKRDGGGGS